VAPLSHCCSGFSWGFEYYMWGPCSYLQTALVQPMRTVEQSHDRIVLLVLQVHQIKRSEDPK
jgi:hypothetical protein